MENIHSVNGMIKIDVSKLNSGSYFVKLVENNSQVKLGKFVVVR